MLEEQYKKICSRISKDDKIAILHHTDVDGICSGVLLTKAIERVIGKKPGIILNQAHNEVTLTLETLEKLRKERITLLFIIDLAVDQNPKTIKDAEGFCRIIVIDHHEPKTNINSDRTLCIKSQYVSKLEGGKYPASKLCFDIFEKYIENLKWLASLGTYGDGAYIQWKSFIDSQFRDIAELQEAAKLITAAETFGAVRECFEIVYNASQIPQILNSNLKNYKKKLENELSKWENEGRVNIPEKNIIWYRITPKDAIASILSTEIGLKNQNKLVFVIQDLKNGLLNISARNFSGEFDVNAIISKAVFGLKNATGGGHKSAAGATIMRKDYRLFKQRIMKIIETFE